MCPPRFILCVRAPKCLCSQLTTCVSSFVDPLQYGRLLLAYVTYRILISLSLFYTSVIMLYNSYDILKLWLSQPIYKLNFNIPYLDTCL